MYPLQMTLTKGVGFAVANDKAEHQALTAQGYGPGYVDPKKAKAAAAEASTSTGDAQAPEGE